MQAARAHYTYCRIPESVVCVCALKEELASKIEETVPIVCECPKKIGKPQRLTEDRAEDTKGGHNQKLLLIPGLYIIGSGIQETGTHVWPAKEESFHVFYHQLLYLFEERAGLPTGTPTATTTCGGIFGGLLYPFEERAGLPTGTLTATTTCGGIFGGLIVSGLYNLWSQQLQDSGSGGVGSSVGILMPIAGGIIGGMIGCCLCDHWIQQQQDRGEEDQQPVEQRSAYHLTGSDTGDLDLEVVCQDKLHIIV